MSSLTRRRHLGRAASRTLVIQKALEDVDRRVERSAGRAVLLLAIPPAIRHLLAEQPLDDAAHVQAEVRAGRNDASVDARLDLACEYRCPMPWAAGVPRRVVADETDRVPRLLARSVEPHVAEHSEGEQRWPLRIRPVGVPQPILLPDR